MADADTKDLKMGTDVRHVDGGKGIVVGFRVVAREESWSSFRSHDALVEWEDKSRSWECMEDLEALDA